MISRMSRSRQGSGPSSDLTPGGLGNMLGELSTNSPLRVMKTKKHGAHRGSPYGNGGGRRGNARWFRGSAAQSQRSDQLLCDDGKELLTPGRAHSAMFVADKHIEIPKEGAPHGLSFKDEAYVGVVVSGMAEGSPAVADGMLVGDSVSAVNGESIKSAAHAKALVEDARYQGKSATITAAGSTRAVTMDKRTGDLGMTCSAAAHMSRGVLLKRIAAGSLAEKSAIYPGDTIISVNGELVYEHASAVKLMNACKAEVHLVMWGQSTEVSLPGHGEANGLGVTLINHEQPTDGPGVKVLKVNPEGRCAKAGLSAGDLLLAVHGVLVTDHAQALALLEAKDVERVKVVFQDKYSR